jgi:hypothetical protein
MDTETMEKTHTQILLDKARTLCLPQTDYELAKRTGISKQVISRARRKGGTLDNEGVARLAKFIDQPFMDVLALVELDRAKTPAKKNFWESYAPRLLPSLIAACGLAALGHSEEVSAASQLVRSTNPQLIEQLIPYAKYTCKGFIGMSRSS